MKSLIVGCRGMLGTELMTVFAALGPVSGMDIEELDITDLGKCTARVNEVRPDLVVNAAALTAVDYCEAHEEEALRVNAQGPGNLAEAAFSVGARLIHYSTDYVFDGRKEGPYFEEDPASPRSAYGRSKLQGEVLVRSRCAEHLIVRTAWLFGRHGGNFIRTILKAARAGQVLRVVDDQRGSPTYARDLAACTARLARAGGRGTYHVTNSGSCSWYQLACRAIEWAGLEGITIHPVTSAEYPRPAPRPANSVLANSRLENEGLGLLRPWEEAVQEYIYECEKN